MTERIGGMECDLIAGESGSVFVPWSGDTTRSRALTPTPTEHELPGVGTYLGTVRVRVEQPALVYDSPEFRRLKSSQMRVWDGYVWNCGGGELR